MGELGMGVNQCRHRQLASGDQSFLSAGIAIFWHSSGCASSGQRRHPRGQRRLALSAAPAAYRHNLAEHRGGGDFRMASAASRIGGVDCRTERCAVRFLLFAGVMVLCAVQRGGESGGCEPRRCEAEADRVLHREPAGFCAGIIEQADGGDIASRASAARCLAVEPDGKGQVAGGRVEKSCSRKMAILCAYAGVLRGNVLDSA